MAARRLAALLLLSILLALFLGSQPSAGLGKLKKIKKLLPLLLGLKKAKKAFLLLPFPIP